MKSYADPPWNQRAARHGEKTVAVLLFANHWVRLRSWKIVTDSLRRRSSMLVDQFVQSPRSGCGLIRLQAMWDRRRRLSVADVSLYRQYGRNTLWTWTSWDLWGGQMLQAYVPRNSNTRLMTAMVFMLHMNWFCHSSSLSSYGFILPERFCIVFSYEEDWSAERLRARVAELETCQHMAVWHDHSPIADKTHYLVLVCFLYDKAIFLSAEELGWVWLLNDLLAKS